MDESMHAEPSVKRRAGAERGKEKAMKRARDRTTLRRTGVKVSRSRRGNERDVSCIVSRDCDNRRDECMNRREEYAMHMPEYVYVSGRNETDDIYNPITDGWMD